MSKLKNIFLIIFIAILGAALASGFFRYQKQKADRLKAIEAAKNLKKEEVSVTLIEGWGIKDIANYLEKEKLVSAKDFLVLQDSYNLSDKFSIYQKPKTADLEGFLYPDTYRIFKPESFNQKQTAEEIISKSLANFYKKFSPEMVQKAQTIGYTPYEVLVLASVVENETGRNAVSPESKLRLDEERQIVAGIFLNRLKAKIPLQSDATINYITGKNDPAPLLEDLKIKSPYNTYLNPGLPPGPICSPSLSSINAVLNSKKTDYYYFLHKQPSGEPVYSKTFEEHVANKNRYLK